MVTTEIDDKKVKITLNHIKDASKDMKRPFRIIAQEMRESVRENFEVGGRFSKAGSVIGGTSKWAKGKFGGSLFSPGSKRTPIRYKPTPRSFYFNPKTIIQKFTLVYNKGNVANYTIASQQDTNKLTLLYPT